MGPGPITTTLSPATSPPSSVRPYMAVPAVTTSVASSSDMVSAILISVLMLLTAYSAEAAVGGEAVGAVALVDLAVVEAVVQAGRVHAHAAALALAAAGVDLHRDAVADGELVDAGPERCDRAHVLVAGRPVLVEGQAALDQRRRPVRDHVEVGGADRDRVDAHQHLGPLRHRHRLLREPQLARDRRAPRRACCRAPACSGWSSRRQVRTCSLPPTIGARDAADHIFSWRHGVRLARNDSMVRGKMR